MKKTKTTSGGERKKVEVIIALFEGKHLVGWYGGDGTRIPVWENDEVGKEESKFFLENNKYHKPKLVKATITFTLPPLSRKVIKKKR